MDIEPVTPLALANTFIESFKWTGRLTHLRLQKICYFTYCEWLVKYGTRLLTEAPIATKYGPVFTSLFRIFEHKRHKEITRPEQATPFTEIERVTDESILKFMGEVWDVYSKADVLNLSKLANDVNTPWERYVTAHKRESIIDLNLSDEVIKEYFVRPTSKELAEIPKELEGGVDLSKEDNYNQEMIDEGRYKARIVGTYIKYKGFFFKKRKSLIIIWRIEQGEFKNFIFKQKLELWSNDSFYRSQAWRNLFSLRTCVLGCEKDGSVVELENTNQLLGLEAVIDIEEVAPWDKKLITRIEGRPPKRR